MLPTLYCISKDSLLAPTSPVSLTFLCLMYQLRTPQVATAAAAAAEEAAAAAAATKRANMPSIDVNVPSIDVKTPLTNVKAQLKHVNSH